MREAVDAKLLSNDTSVAIGAVKRTTFRAGGYEEKQLVEGNVANRNVALIERQYRQKYVDNWRAFKEAGLPVVPTLRYTVDTENQSPKTLLMTDLKADGSEIYGRNFLIAIEKAGSLRKKTNRNTRFRPRHKIDSIFLEVTTPDGMEEIKNKVNEYVQIATTNGIALPEDDPFDLIVHPDKTWELKTLDLFLATLHQKAPSEWNKNCGKLFIGYLEEVGSTLKEKKLLVFRES